jgi:hypothetical protein
VAGVAVSVPGYVLLRPVVPHLVVWHGRRRAQFSRLRARSSTAPPARPCLSPSLPRARPGISLALVAALGDGAAAGLAVEAVLSLLAGRTG